VSGVEEDEEVVICRRDGIEVEVQSIAFCWCGDYVSDGFAYRCVWGDDGERTPKASSRPGMKGAMQMIRSVNRVTYNKWRKRRTTTSNINYTIGRKSWELDVEVFDVVEEAFLPGYEVRLAVHPLRASLGFGNTKDCAMISMANPS
jgi:hypothetical protein